MFATSDRWREPGESVR